MMAGTGGMRVLARAIVIVLLMCIPAIAHDSWISSGGFRGKGQAANEWCCGSGDCAPLNYTPIISADGYVLRGGEVVPYSEAQPSPDGTYWRCKRPDGTRRCFFAPPSTN